MKWTGNDKDDRDFFQPEMIKMRQNEIVKRCQHITITISEIEHLVSELHNVPISRKVLEHFNTSLVSL